MTDPSRPLRILVYSDNPRTASRCSWRWQAVHPDLPELTYLEVATRHDGDQQMDEGGLSIWSCLDGEASPAGGLGSPNS